MADEETRQRVAEELQQLIEIVEQITGLQSRWSGSVELVPDAEFRGLKPFRCDILLDAGLAFKEIRWRTWLHEVLHSVSAGYNLIDFNAGQGWEEGVVEALQRHLRVSVLSAIGVDVEEAIFLAAEQEHAFNRYIAALENIRTALDQDAQTFYIYLLRTPIKDRHGMLLRQALAAQGEQRKALLEIISAARAVLEAKSR